MSSRGPNFGLPALGVGVGLRRKHADQVARERPAMRWFEFTPEQPTSFHTKPVTGYISPASELNAASSSFA